LKVLIIGSRIPWPLHDGGAIATFNLLKGLSDLGVDICYLSLNTNKHFVDDLTLKEKFSFLYKVRTRSINTNISAYKAFLNLFRNTSYNIDRFTSQDFAQDIQDELNSDSYDLIHFEGLFVSQYINLISCNIPCLLRQHNIEFHIWKTLANAAKNPLKKWYLKLLANRLEKFELQTIKHFNALVGITENDKIALENFGFNGLLSSIPAGIEADVPNETPIQFNSVYHIGSMEWLPNRDAMEWFHNSIWPLVQVSPAPTFYMAGKHMPANYHSWNSDSFKVIGEVDKLTDFVSDKSILVVPLRSGSGIRIKTLEAMFAGKAVVTTSQGALGIDLVHKKHALIADNAEDFANAINSLLTNHEYRNEIAKTAQEFVLKNYGNSSVSKRWIDFYNLLLKNFKNS
jgi:glycosyltransferase involved in cell wall biosynthesis